MRSPNWGGQSPWAQLLSVIRSLGNLCAAWEGQCFTNKGLIYRFPQEWQWLSFHVPFCPCAHANFTWAFLSPLHGFRFRIEFTHANTLPILYSVFKRFWTRAVDHIPTSNRGLLTYSPETGNLPTALDIRDHPSHYSKTCNFLPAPQSPTCNHSTNS